MDIGVEFMDSKLYKCEFCVANKLKACPYSEGHFVNTVSEKVFFDLVFPIISLGYNGLKGYIF